MSDKGRRALDRAYEGLERHAPGRVSRAIRWLRIPEARWLRLPLGVLLLVGGILGPVLPIVGLELIPAGLLLIAQDVPFLQEPVGRSTIWLERKWMAYRQRRRRNRRQP